MFVDRYSYKINHRQQHGRVERIACSPVRKSELKHNRECS